MRVLFKHLLKSYSANAALVVDELVLKMQLLAEIQRVFVPARKILLHREKSQINSFLPNAPYEGCPVEWKCPERHRGKPAQEDAESTLAVALAVAVQDAAVPEETLTARLRSSRRSPGTRSPRIEGVIRLDATLDHV